MKSKPKWAKLPKDCTCWKSWKENRPGTWSCLCKIFKKVEKVMSKQIEKALWK